jgi:ATP-dependent RNA helicase DDX42
MTEGLRFSGMSLPDATFRSAAFEEPELVQSLHRQEPPVVPAPTNFSLWEEKDILAFLELRGEDYDDCIDFYALVAKAAECEHNTGPATKVATPAADDEEDPLETFMATNTVSEAVPVNKMPAGERGTGCDDEDHMESYIAAHDLRQRSRLNAAQNLCASGYGSDEEVYAVAQAIDDVKSEGRTAQRTNVEPLPRIDHSTISYRPFKRNFYDENPELFVLEDSEVSNIRAALQIQVSGADVPKPISEFEHCGFPKPLADIINRSGYTTPTAIQAQVLPVR